MRITRRDFSKWGGLLLCSIGVYGAAQFSDPAPKPKALETLGIYYGIPADVNNSSGSIDKAVKNFSKFDNLVLGEGLEFPEHSEQPEHEKEHEKTKEIIPRLKNTRVFGYITLDNHTSNSHSLDGIDDRIDAWYGMKANGIFFDQVAFFAYGVDYYRLGRAISRCREKNMSVFLNGDADWIKKSNLLRRGDSVLIEPFAYSGGIEVSDNNPYYGWAADRGIKVFGVATCDTRVHSNSIKRVIETAQKAARRAMLNGLAIADPLYSSRHAHANYLLIPRSVI